MDYNTSRRSAKRPKAPKADDATLSMLTQWCQRDINFWSLRDTRFQRDQNLYLLSSADDQASWTRHQKDVIILNDPRVMIKKVARILARHPNTIEAVPVKPELQDTAQRIENFCYSFDQSIAYKWVEGLNNPFRYDQAFWLCLRGWLVSRTLLVPDGQADMETDASAIYDHQLFDPANVYPYVSGGKITRVCHYYETTIGDFRHDPVIASVMDSEAYQNMVDRDENERIKVTAYYWKAEDGGWYHAIITANEWIKPPTEIGYNPWIITTANGASFRTTPWDESQYIDQVGTGILDESAQNQIYLNRAITKLNALLSLEANPPLTLFTADGRPRQVSFEPGSRMFLTQKDRVEAHRVGPQLNDYKLLWDILVQRADRAGLPAAFYAEFTGENSMAHSAMMAAGRDVLYPYTEAINMADQMTYRKVLELYRDYGPSQPLQGKSQPNAFGVGAFAQVTAQDITQQGAFVEVTRADMTPQETLQRINMALSLAKEKVLSMKTIRGRDWLGVRNPQKENIQVLAEQVYLDPEVIKTLVPAALAETGQEALLEIWRTIRSGVPQTGSPADAALQNRAQAGMNQPGAQVLPPGAATGNPMMTANRPPDAAMQAELLKLITGGAFGGIGSGGRPPIPGTTSSIPIPGGPGRTFGVQ